MQIVVNTVHSSQFTVHTVPPSDVITLFIFINIAPFKTMLEGAYQYIAIENIVNKKTVLKQEYIIKQNDKTVQQ